MLSLLEFGKFILRAINTAVDKFFQITVTFKDLSYGKNNGTVIVTFPPTAPGFKKVVVNLSKKQFIEQFVVGD